nr:hypothetical protein [Alcaligenes faecalis]
MAVHFNSFQPISAFQTSDLRTLRLYARYLNNSHGIRNAPQPLPPFPRHPLPEAGTVRELKEAFNRYLADHYPYNGDNFLYTLNTQLQGLAQAHILEMGKFKWLEEDEQACIFFYLSTTPYINIKDLSQGLEQARANSNRNIAKSHEARYKCLIEEFDSLDFEPIRGKQDYFKSLEHQYAEAKNKVKPLIWLTPNNNEACHWAWNYLTSYHEREIASAKESGKLEFSLASNSIGIPLLFWLTPNNAKEQCLAFYAALQTWKCHPAELKQLRTNLAKAWRQQQVRKSTTTKPINTHIKAEAKVQLDELSRHYKWSLPKTLEVLISDAHKTIKK